MCSTFCLQNCFLQPTKWYGHKLDYKISFSSLHNGMATNSTLQNGVPCQLSWTFVSKNDFDMFIQKWSSRTFAFMLQKNPGPLCRASTLSGTQFQGQFSIAILPCHSFLFNFTQNWFKKMFRNFCTWPNRARQLSWLMVAIWDWASTSEQNLLRKWPARNKFNCFFLNSTSDYKIRCTTSYRYQIRCMPSDYKIGCTISYCYHIQCMPSDGCTTSYRYHIQCMPSDYKIGLHHFNLFLPFSLNSPPNQEL